MIIRETRIDKISALLIMIMIGVAISFSIIGLFPKKPASSTENNVGEVVKITNCGQVYTSLLTSFPDYILYVRGIGSGISIENGYILSSAHIFCDEKQLPFINEQYYAKIIKKDLNFDLILLKTPSIMRPFKIASSIRVGEKVIIWGYPFGSQNMLFGRVSNFNEEIMFLDAKVIRGMSGGAVINEKGELLGVFKGGIGEPDMLAIAVNFPRIKKFLKGTPAEYK